MIRESLDPSSKHGMSILSSSYGMLYQGRNTTGGTSIGLPTLGATTPIWTKLERRGPVLIGWKSLDGATWDWVGSQPVSMATQAYAGLADNAHNNAALSLATFDNLQVTAGRENELPTPWNELMLGSPVLGGWAGFANNTFSLYAGGGDTWGPADQGEFVYRPLNGDGTITLKVANVKNSQEWAKAGVMMRETLSPDARHILWGVSPTHGVLLQKRVTPGTTPSNYYDSTTVAPVWLKLQRTGNIFTASKSNDGVTWNIFGTETLPMDVNIYAGAILSSPSTTVIGQTDIPTLTMTVPAIHNYTPLAWWPMNEGSGTTLVDATTGHHDGTLSGTVVRTSGHDGSGGINLPSGDATAYVTTQTLMAGSSSLSVSAWFKTTDSGVRRIISKGHWGASTGFLLGIGHSAPGRLTFGIGGGTAAESVLMSTTESFNNGAWHHVVGVYDSGAHTARMYVDGTLRNVALTASIWGGTIIEAGKALDTTALTQLSTISNIALHVGSYNGQREQWIGELDDVRLYGVALDDLAVQNLYASADGDSLPDSWEQRIVDFSSTDDITSVAQVLPGDDFDGDGLANLQEYQQGSDPTDYYNGQLPSITILSGNNQQAASGALVADPVIVKVTDASGEILANAPVQFNANTSGAGLSAAVAGSLLPNLSLRSGADGTVAVYPAPAGEKGSPSAFQAAAFSGNQMQTIAFTAVVHADKVTPMIASGGYRNGAVLKSDGTMWAWGMHLIGDTSATDRQPIQITIAADGTAFTDVKAVAVGAFHAIALKSDGTVWTWGANYRGELGNGTGTIQNTKPARVLGLNETTENPVIAIAAGPYYSLALKQDHTVWTWGTGLGPSESDHLTATKVRMADGSDLTDVIAIAAGDDYHALAVKNNHTVWAWGQNYWGQLGDNTTIKKGTPVQVLRAGVPLEGIDEVGAGDGFSVALNKTDGTMWAWGLNWANELNNYLLTDSLEAVQTEGFDTNNPPVALSCDRDCVLALTADSSVWAWGNNSYGVLGDGTVAKPGEAWYHYGISVPTRVSALTNIIGIGTGIGSFYAIDNIGRIWEWGIFAGLGDEPQYDAAVPAIVNSDKNGLPFADIKEVGASYGAVATIVLKNDGSVWTCGDNSHGTLGDGTAVSSTLFQQVSGLQNIEHVCASDYFVLALDNIGQVWFSGTYSYSLAGDPPSTVPSKIQTSSRVDLVNIIALAPGVSHVLALDANHNVWAWGDNSFGQIGDGSRNNQILDAVQVTDSQGNPLGDITKIAAGNGISLALDANGRVWTWGGDSAYPVQKDDLPDNIRAISASMHGLAIDDAGRVWAWGDNTYGQLGGGTSLNYSSTPIEVSGLGSNSPVAEVYASQTFSLVRKADGTVWVWGFLPFTNFGASTTPFQLTSLGKVSKLTVSDSGIYAVHSDNSMAVLGSGLGLGYGSTIGGPLPQLVGGINVLAESPQVAITSPAASTSANLGTPIALQINGNGSQIGKVDFYNENAWIGSSTSSSFLWQPPTWGTYHIHAVLTNPEGFKSAYSNVITLLVPYAAPTPPPDPDPEDDTDKDGVTDAQEITAGTDPNQKDNPALNLNVNVFVK
jgi:alpha-tubulin suppressor-like RCC1 family protein